MVSFFCAALDGLGLSLLLPWYLYNSVVAPSALLMDLLYFSVSLPFSWLSFGVNQISPATQRMEVTVLVCSVTVVPPFTAAVVVQVGVSVLFAVLETVVEGNSFIQFF